MFTMSSPDIREATTVTQPNQPPHQSDQDHDHDSSDRRRDEDGNIEFDCD